MEILITGGAGFIGSNLAIGLKEKGFKVKVLDNLKRRGSELNLPRLKERGIQFFHGDIRNVYDIYEAGSFDLMIECSAEPSVVVGYDSDPDYCIDTNLFGTKNCLAACKKYKANIIFLSTSRIYPLDILNSLKYKELETRFEPDEDQIIGLSSKGISENFPTEGVKSFYGSSKFCSESLVQEYSFAYDLKYIINRCSVICGPWQFGKVDQGVFALWIAYHYFGKNLSYIGYGGKGKQVRDFLNISDLLELILLQIKNLDKVYNITFNVGGGKENSLSLKELTSLAQEIVGIKVQISSVLETRKMDVPYFVADYTKVKNIYNWSPKKSVEETAKEVFEWIVKHENVLRNIF